MFNKKTKFTIILSIIVILYMIYKIIPDDDINEDKNNESFETSNLKSKSNELLSELMNNQILIKNFIYGSFNNQETKTLLVNLLNSQKNISREICKRNNLVNRKIELEELFKDNIFVLTNIIIGFKEMLSTIGRNNYEDNKHKFMLGTRKILLNCENISNILTNNETRKNKIKQKLYSYYENICLIIYWKYYNKEDLVNEYTMKSNNELILLYDML